MGQILSAPITEKHSEKGEDKYLVYALSCMQGWRMSMEDAHATVLNLNTLSKRSPYIEDDEDLKVEEEEEEEDNQTNDNKDNQLDHVAFFGVYDGHGGEKAAIYTGENLHQIVKNTEAYAKQDYINALKEGFLNCDQHILRDWRIVDDDSGCAATSVIITPNSIYCGNAGDSRTIMSINGFAKALSFDHKPSNEGEKARISNAGGFVDMGRVNGNLALSRGIGDFEFKRNIDLPAEEQIVTALPDVLKHSINFETDEFIVLACDGIWDCLTSQKCVECVRRGIFERKPLTQICEEIMELCCAPTTDGSGIGCDNMSISIVVLLDYKNNETLDQWYDKIISRIEQVNQELLASSSTITTNTTSTSASISKSTSTSSDTSSKSIPTESQLQSRTTTPSFKYGPISAPYEQIYKEMYGDFYEIGQRGNQNNGNQNGNGRLGGAGGSPLSSISNGVFPTGRSFGNVDEELEGRSHIREVGDDEDDDDEGDDLSRRELSNGAISLQKLLASNAITNENGVIYLDTSSAQSILAHFGMGDDSPSTTTTSIEEEDEDDDDDEDDVHVNDDDEDDVHVNDVHEKHIEEEDLEDDSKK